MESSEQSKVRKMKTQNQKRKKKNENDFLIKNTQPIQVKIGETNVISKFHKIIYNDESINIVSTKKLGAGVYLFQKGEDIIELFRVDNFINLSWFPGATSD